MCTGVHLDYLVTISIDCIGGGGGGGDLVLYFVYTYIIYQHLTNYQVISRVPAVSLVPPLPAHDRCGHAASEPYHLSRGRCALA